MADPIQQLEQPGLFPDGPFGRKGLLRNRSQIERMGEMILGDAESAAMLENMGQSAQVEVLLDQGMRANTRAAQRPYLNALAQIVDGMGLFERDVQVFDERVQEVGRSLLALRTNVAPDQLPQLTQLFHATGRAADRASMAPGAALDELMGIEEQVLTLSQEAGDRMRTAFVEPLERMQVEYEAARGQLLSASGGNMDALATAQEVVQILNLVGTQTSQELAGLGISTPFGTFGPDDVPDLTYAELLNTINSRENAVTDLTAKVLEERGFTELQSTPQRIRPTRRTNALQTQAAIDAAVKEATGVTTQRGPGSPGLSILENIMGRYPGAELNADQGTLTLQDGTAIRLPPSARAQLEQLRRQRSSRERVNSR